MSATERVRAALAALRDDDLAKRSLAAQATGTTGLADLARDLTVGAAAVPFGPGVPIAPTFPAEEPRRWDFTPGYNIQTRPRGYEGLQFRDLRGLADGYDVARLCIEKRKDELRRLQWAIRPRGVAGLTRAEARAQTARTEDAAATVTGFFLTPNQEDAWGAWLGQWAEDLFAIDAATIFLRPSRSGGLFALEVLDGTTIRPIIDGYGRAPAPPEPAYGQVIKGITYAMFSRDELLYSPYWQRPQSPYGNPPMAWVVMAANRAIRRQTLDLSLYTEGTMPSAFYRVAADLPATQLRELQDLLDELLAGNDAARSRVRLMPGGPGTGLDRVNPDPSTEAEAWLMHLTCAAFGVNPSELGFVDKGSGLGGKGFAETARDTAGRREVATAEHLKGILDRVIAGPLGQPELEFVWTDLEAAEDALGQAQANKLYVDMGALSVDEVRADVLDRDPIGLGPYVAGQTVTLVSDLLAPPEPVPAALVPFAGQNNAPAQEPAPEDDGNAPPPTPSAEEGELTDDEAVAAPAEKAAAADLAAWQRKALRAVRDGRDPARFTSAAIDAPTAAFLRDALAGAHDPDDVRAAFALAKKAGASAGPFAPAPGAPSAASSPRGSAGRAATWYARWD